MAELGSEIEYLESQDVLLFRVAEAIKIVDDSCAIVQFGSSVSNKNSNDIDLLVMSNIDYSGSVYRSSIENLKNDLLSGNPSAGFDVYCGKMQDKTDGVIRNLRLNHLPIVAKFVLGPCPPSQDAVHLHIMGPITRRQFVLFCEYFPFHSKVIIVKSRTISGNIEMSDFEKHIKLEEEEFIRLALSLKTRVEKSGDAIDVRKCIRKIVMNFNLLKDRVCNVACLSFGNMGNHPTSVAGETCLKPVFFDIYAKMFSEIGVR